MNMSMTMKAGNGGAIERTTQPIDMPAQATRSEVWRPKWCSMKEDDMDERKYPAVLARKTIEILS